MADESLDLLRQYARGIQDVSAVAERYTQIQSAMASGDKTLASSLRATATAAEKSALDILKIHASASATAKSSGVLAAALAALGDKTERQSASSTKFAQALDLASNRAYASVGSFGAAAKQLVSIGGAAGIAAAAVVAVGAGILAAGLHAAPFTRDLKDLENTLGLVGNQSVAARLAVSDLRVAALSASGMGVGPREAAQALGELASLGFNAKDAIDALNPVMLLAKARGLDVATAAKIAGAVTATFGIEAKNLGGELDKLSVISNLTGLQANDLAMFIAKAGRGAIAAGQDFNSMAIAAGLARNSGIAIEEVMTGVGSGLIYLSTRGREAFKELTRGKDTIDATTGKMRPFEMILIDVAQATKGLDDAAKANALKRMFGVESLNPILANIGQLTNGIKDSNGNILKMGEAAAYMRGELEKAAGSNERFAKNLADTWEGQKAKFEALTDSIVTGIGMRIEPSLARMLGAANTALGGIAARLTETEEVVRPVQEGFSKLEGNTLTLGKATVDLNDAAGKSAPALNAAGESTETLKKRLQAQAKATRDAAREWKQYTEQLQARASKGATPDLLWDSLQDATGEARNKVYDAVNETTGFIHKEFKNPELIQAPIAGQVDESIDEMKRLAAEAEARADKVASGWGQALGGVESIFGTLSDTAIKQSKKQGDAAEKAAIRFFRIQQAAAIAGAIVNTSQAIVAQLTVPYIGWGLAIAAGLAGAAQIAAIASQSPPSSSGTSGAAPTPPSMPNMSIASGSSSSSSSRSAAENRNEVPEAMTVSSGPSYRTAQADTSMAVTEVSDARIGPSAGSMLLKTTPGDTVDVYRGGLGADGRNKPLLEATERQTREIQGLRSDVQALTAMLAYRSHREAAGGPLRRQ